MRKSFATNWLAVAFGVALTVEALTGAAAISGVMETNAQNEADALASSI